MKKELSKDITDIINTITEPVIINNKEIKIFPFAKYREILIDEAGFLYCYKRFYKTQEIPYDLQSFTNFEIKNDNPSHIEITKDFCKEKGLPCRNDCNLGEAIDVALDANNIIITNFLDKSYSIFFPKHGSLYQLYQLEILLDYIENMENLRDSKLDKHRINYLFVKLPNSSLEIPIDKNISNNLSEILNEVAKTVSSKTRR